MTEKFPELEIQKLKNEDDRKDFLGEYCYSYGGLALTKPGTKRFQRLLRDLQNNLAVKSGQRRFVISTANGSTLRT